MALHEAPGRRDRVFRRDGFRCVYCGSPSPPAELTLDHVEPRMRGGDQTEGNLVACCEACNRLKAGQPAWRFLATRPELRASFLAAHAASTARQGSDDGTAQPVWSRLVRAIEEAATRAGGDARRATGGSGRLSNE